MRRMRLWIAVFALLAAASPRERGAFAAIPLAEEAQAGQGFVKAFASQYGVSENARYRELAESALQSLVRASGERPELQWRVVVLKYSAANPVAKNASAWPGGQIITDEEFLRTIDTAAEGDADRARALLAGVLAHEMAHVIRHDTDGLATAFSQNPNATPQALLQTLNGSAAGTRTDAADQRKRETECDRYGAFYLVRAGYPVERMIDVFTRLGQEKIDEVLFNSDLDHARSGDRVATVLQVKAQVIEDERLYDEAVNILRIGMDEEMMRVAEQDLEAVSAHFPTMLPVRHALAVLYHRKYLLTVSPEALKYKPSFSFYRFHQKRSLEDLDAAIRAYEAILKDYAAEGWKGLGPTAAAYALALAQTGRQKDSLEWAQRAVQLAPEDWSAYNVLGIALQKAGQAAQAIEPLKKAVALGAPAEVMPLVEKPFLLPSLEERAIWHFVGTQEPVECGPAYYNLGMAQQAAGDKADAARAFSAYLATDAPDLAPELRSDWARLALAYLGALPRGVSAPPARVQPIAGLLPGMEKTEILRKLGDKRAVAPVEPGGEVWRYREKGFSLFLDGGSSLRAALVSAPYAAEIAPGIKIGASAAQVEKIWGKPAAPAQSAERQAWSYPAQGVTLLFTRGILTKVVWSPGPPVGGARVQSSVQIGPGDAAEKVKQVLGPPDSGAGQESQGGAWTYDRGLRIRFDRQGQVALVTITRPSSADVAGVKLGDSPSRIRQVMGGGFVSADVDQSQTYNYPDRGLAFMVRNAEVSTMILFANQATPAPKKLPAPPK